MQSIISLGNLGDGAGILAGGAQFAAGFGKGALRGAGDTAMGTFRLAKDTVQALSPIGAGGSQARKRLMERGLIESGVNRTKQLKRMAGKTAGLLGVNLSLASILKQSQIFTGVFGTVFQILGAFVDIMLIPLMPVIKWVLNNMIDFIPTVQAKATALEGFGKRAAAYLESVKQDTKGVWEFIKRLASDAWSKVIVPWWKGPDGWEKIYQGLKDAIQWGLEKAGLLEPIKPMTEVDELMEKMIKEFARQGMKIPKMPMGGGSAIEFEDLGEVPEGYGGVPSIGVIPSQPGVPNTGIPQAIDFLQAAEENVQRGFSSISGTLMPHVRSPITRKEGGFLGLGYQSPFPDPLREAERGIQQEMGANFLLETGKNILGAIGITQTPPLPGAGGVLGIGAGGVAQTKPYVEQGSVMEGPLPGYDSRAEGVIQLTNQAKDNYVARYHDEAAQYEDELYFQEMMLGVGRY